MYNKVFFHGNSVEQYGKAFLSNLIHNYNILQPGTQSLRHFVNLLIITCAGGERAQETRFHLLSHYVTVLCAQVYAFT